MRLILGFALLGFCFAQADYSAALGGGVRFVSDSNGVSFSRHYPIRLGGDMNIFERFRLGLEVSRYNYKTGTGNLEISTEHYEVVSWLRGSVWKIPSWYPYGMFGLGLQKQFVTTDFMGMSSRDEGKWDWVLGLGLGVFNRVIGDFAAGGELRYAYRPWGAPRSSVDALLLLGWIF